MFRERPLSRFGSDGRLLETLEPEEQALEAKTSRDLQPAASYRRTPADQGFDIWVARPREPVQVARHWRALLERWARAPLPRPGASAERFGHGVTACRPACSGAGQAWVKEVPELRG